MKKNLKKAFAALLAAVMAFTVLPFFGAYAEANATGLKTPEGYNENDYQKLVSFLEKTDAQGVKNGEKLSPDYDPEDPSTWGEWFSWIGVEGEMRIWNINVSWNEMHGSLDVSDCTSLASLVCSFNTEMGGLNVSGCTALEELECLACGLSELDVSGNTELRGLVCSNNFLHELDVSNNTELTDLLCGRNAYTELDVSNNVKLRWLQCNNLNLTELDVSMLPDLDNLDCAENLLTSLDVSHNPLLNTLNAQGNRFRELDFSSSPLMAFDHITVEGNGFVGYGYSNVDGNDSGMLHGYAPEGVEFEGFFDAQGNLINGGFPQDYYEEYATYEYMFENYPTGDVVVRFTGGADLLMGDVNGDGAVTMEDSVAVVRYLLDLVSADSLNLAAADMDGNGSVTVSDAVLILRAAMGLAQ